VGATGVGMGSGYGRDPIMPQINLNEAL